MENGTPSKFVQILFEDDELYALDEDGRIWSFVRKFTPMDAFNRRTYVGAQWKEITAWGE